MSERETVDELTTAYLVGFHKRDDEVAALRKKLAEAQAQALEEAADKMQNELKNECLCYEVPQWLRRLAAEKRK